MIFPLRVGAGAQPLHRRRAIVVVLQIAFAVVDDHHRPANRLGHDRGFRGVVGHQPPAEAAADARASGRGPCRSRTPVARATTDCALIGIWIGPRTQISPIA